MNLKIPVLFNAVLFFVLVVKASEKKNMKAGEKITLLTGFTELHGEYSVLLYLKNGTQKDNLIKCDGKNVECELSKTFEGKLDGESGSLTFGPLNVKDSGVYVIQTTNGDSDVLEKYYEVTVSDDPNPVTAKRPENSNDPNNPRTQIGLCGALPIVCAISILLGASFLIFKKKTQTEKKGNTQDEML